MEAIPELMLPEEVAGLLRLSKKTVLRMAAAGTLPCIRLGNGKQKDPCRFSRKQIEKVLTARSSIVK